MGWTISVTNHYYFLSGFGQSKQLQNDVITTKDNKYIDCGERRFVHNTIIFTHLKLCLADAIHNFKWVKIIQIWKNEVNCFQIGRVYLPRHGAHKARKVRWITSDGANNS